MFDRFSREDRTLFMFATQEARDLGHRALGNDHMILGMLCNARSPMFGVLSEQGFALDAARKVVAQTHAAADNADTDGSSPADSRAGSTPDADRYEEDREVLRGIGIDLDRIRESIRSTFGDDLVDGWGERTGRRDRRTRGPHGRGPHGRGRGPGFRPEFGPDWGADNPWEGGPWDGGRGRLGPRGRGRPRAEASMRDAMRSAVRLARERGDERITVAHLLLGILDVNDAAARVLIESVTDRETLRTRVEKLLEPAQV